MRNTESVAAPALPEGEIVIRTIAQPADTNANGDVFGGWLMGQMDLGGAVMARNVARCRVVTVAVDAMCFRAPVNVGDTVTCYAKLREVGRTSMKIDIRVWVQHFTDGRWQLVTDGLFTYVAIDADGKSQPVHRE